MRDKKWHELARKMYYEEGKTMVEIQGVIGVTRQSISKFLQRDNPNAFEAEKKRRKKETEERTRQVKREYRSNNPEKVLQSRIKYQARRLGMTPEEYEIYRFQRLTLKDELRQQHEDDVMVMSSHGMPRTISNSELSYYRSAYRPTKSGNLRRLVATKDGAAVPEIGLPRIISKRI